MKIVRTIPDLNAALDGRRVGFVPTMGAFHEGHLSLMRACAKEFETTVVSLFVNPTQFGAHEDLSKYPRNEARDAEMAVEAGADVLFAPSIETVYPRRTTVVQVPGVSERWEGAIRPGHFDGVATVVLKLFNLVRPQCAFFGLKDLQQCAVIKRMVEDLNVPIDLRFEPTIREHDGLAMSSRNAYLSPSERERAPMLYQQLTECASTLRDRNGEPQLVERELAQRASTLASAGFRTDYFALVETDTLEPAARAQDGTSLISAVRLGKTRLIDNVQI